MTADEINAYATLIVAIGTLITGIATAIITIRNGKKSERGRQKAEEQAAVITAHVNSAATASVAKIEGLQQQVSDLHTTVAQQTQTAALLAQSVIEKRDL